MRAAILACIGRVAMSARTGSARFYGWRVVAAAFVLAIFGWGMGFYGPPVYLHAVREARGWPLALIVAIGQASYAFAPAFFGLIRDDAPPAEPGAAPLFFIVAAIIQLLAVCAFLLGRGAKLPRSVDVD